jgi:hypothetical protein
MIPHDQSVCPKCSRMHCEGYWGEGVCIADMHFSGEPTSDGDNAAEYLRVWYEAHRETWRDRHNYPFRQGYPGKAGVTADNFMLGLMNEMHRIESERRRQLAKTAA